ncbi:MAG TPA: Mut7-C RNAse domain-containing protein [Myxococcota bacterium]|nr:Mut7-C RNAse domain-containing protein [Myxococcota bacterium]
MNINSRSFLADRMLGRLGKWLRIMGLDCAYVREGNREDIIEQALAERRVLLTRDTRLLRRRRLGPSLFIKSNFPAEQILQVVSQFQIDPLAAAFSRCIRCNRLLEAADPGMIGDRLPLHVRDTQSRIARCPGCGRLYWPSTHISRMRSRLLLIGKQATM